MVKFSAYTLKTSICIYTKCQFVQTRYIVWTDKCSQKEIQHMKVVWQLFYLQLNWKLLHIFLQL